MIKKRIKSYLTGPQLNSVPSSARNNLTGQENMKTKNKLTIIILNYSKTQQAVENVGLLLKQKTDFDCKIIVVDNSGKQENIEILKNKLGNQKKIELIFNQKNLGYIKAHNLIKNKIKGEYVLILNPDVLTKEKKSLAKMIDYMDKNPKIGMIGPKQINDDGKVAMTVRGWPKFYLQVARRTFLRNLPILKKKVEQDEMRHLDYDKIQDVDWLQSSCVLIRRKLWDEIGGFDENYFLFMSDPEICYQVWKRGFRVVYYPEVQVFADGKRLSEGGFLTFFKSWVFRQHVKDSLKYCLKHFFKGDPRKKYYKNNSNYENNSNQNR
jgi:GT2 family glycosyltransferase